METEVKVEPNRCECGGSTKPGKGDKKNLMICARPSCKKRWLVLTCDCGNIVDYRFQQYCEKKYPQCSLMPYNICISGSEVTAGTDSLEGVMFCTDNLCSCHHSRWAYHECSNCGHMVDYRYAAMCECRSCKSSKQYYRICPTCGHCPSTGCKKEAKTVKIVRLNQRKDGKDAAPKVIAHQKSSRQQSLGV